MTNEEARDYIIRHCNPDYSHGKTEWETAINMAIEALSKQCASSEQPGRWIVPGELFMSDRLIEEMLEQIGKNDEAIRTDDHIAESDKMVDQLISKQEVLTNMRTLCGGCYLMEHCGQCNSNCLLRKAIDAVEKIKTDSKRISFFEQEKSNSFSKDPSEDGESEMNCSDVPAIRVGKTDFKPGDKFILELGKERKMFGEFEIAGTDLYVKASLLEKLTRYEPETVTNCHDLMGDTISRQAAIDLFPNDDFEWDTIYGYIAPHVARRLIETLPSIQPERLTDDDFETIRIHLNAFKENLCNQQRWEEADEYQRIIDRFMAFASAQPERKTGRWIQGAVGLMVTEYKCSKCGRTVRDDTGYDVYKDYPYCHCGAEMRKDGEG